MSWKRDWDGECQVYDKWEADGATWTVEDLNPEHDEIAAGIMASQFAKDEPFCSRLEITKTEEGVQYCKGFWHKLITGRTSLACYRHADGGKELVALNVCPVKHINDPVSDPEKPDSLDLKKMECLMGTVDHFEELADVYNRVGVQIYLSGAGLYVLPKYRGARLGGKVLAAREPLCRQLGIRATSTIFTGPASQKLAALCGFRTVVQLTFGDLAAAGFYFPGDQTHVLKVMLRTYDE